MKNERNFKHDGRAWHPVQSSVRGYFQDFEDWQLYCLISYISHIYNWEVNFRNLQRIFLQRYLLPGLGASLGASCVATWGLKYQLVDEEIIVAGKKSSTIISLQIWGFLRILGDCYVVSEHLFVNCDVICWTDARSAAMESCFHNFSPRPFHNCVRFHCKRI